MPAYDVGSSSAHQVPENQRGNHCVVERAEHREELRQQVDR